MNGCAMTSNVLERLGWDEAWAEAARALDPEATPVRVVAEHRGAYHASGALPSVQDRGASEARDPIIGTAWAELTGRAFHRARDKRALPTVGDWVVVTRWAEALAGSGAAVIAHVLPRRGLLVRKAAGEAIAPQPLAANVDRGIVMTSANGDLSQARLDRYIALLRDGGIEPVVVLSKIDLLEDPAPVLARLGAIGVSTVTGAGVDQIRALAGRGRTCVLLGSSGVGKSTLLNTLIGTAQRTQPLRADERGRHTTTRRELFVTDDGCWIDTPGMREIALFDSDVDAFDDITALAANCRFRDCRHDREPGCAVRDAVDPARLRSYHKLKQ